MASGGDGYPLDIGTAVTRELLDQVTAAYITANFADLAEPGTNNLHRFGRGVCSECGEEINVFNLRLDPVPQIVVERIVKAKLAAHAT